MKLWYCKGASKVLLQYTARVDSHSNTSSAEYKTSMAVIHYETSIIQRCRPTMKSQWNGNSRWTLMKPRMHEWNMTRVQKRLTMKPELCEFSKTVVAIESEKKDRKKGREKERERFT